MSTDFDLIHWVNVIREVKTQRDLYYTFDHVSSLYERKQCTRVQYEELRDHVFERFKGKKLVQTT